MSNMYIRLSAWIPLLCLLHLSPVFAGSFYLGSEAGFARLASSGYDKPMMATLFGGYQFSLFRAQLSTYYFEDIESRRFDDTYLELDDAWSLQLNAAIPAGDFNLEAGLGVFVWDLNPVFSGVDVGHDSGSSLLLDLRASKNLGRFFNLFLSAKLIDDVSGSDMQTLSFGMRFIFP